MRISAIKLKNWRNFKSASVEFKADVIYLVGPNASGKSNFLDALRFLRDIAKPIGGGLQTALNERGGFSKVRCLHARGKGQKQKGTTDLGISVKLTEGDENWTYDLAINLRGHGSRHEPPLVAKEIVTKNDKELLRRPNEQDKADSEQLVGTYLEQVTQNLQFRRLATFFSSITYLHLVPQLVKYGERFAGVLMPDDPFGQAFMKRIADTTARTRESRLKKISAALKGIVPGLEGLAFEKDSEGRPHIEIRFKHFRQYPAKQLEDQLSDGTLRLIAMLWLLQEERDAPLLLEEPELSLNEEIVKQLHRLFSKITRNKNQILITTHSYALLSNPGIPGESIFRVIPSAEGSKIEPPSDAQLTAIRNGVPPGDVVFSRDAQYSLDL